MALITKWGDLSMDWTDPVVYEGKYVEALILAVNERCLSIGKISAPPLSLTVMDNNKFCNIATLQTIETKILSLIPLFVNHTDSGGDWTGKTEIPNWTIQKILTEVANATGQKTAYRIATYSKCHLAHEDVKAWFIEMYSIINLLRWVQNSRTYRYPNSFLFSSKSTASVIADYSWIDAVNIFNGSSWSQIQILDHLKPRHISDIIAQFGPERWRIDRIRAVLRINYSSFGGTCDYYTAFETLPGYTYENNDYLGALETSPLLSKMGDAVFTENTNNYLSIGDFGDCTMSEPTSEIPRSWMSEPYFVLKFDGENGFKFKNW